MFILCAYAFYDVFMCMGGCLSAGRGAWYGGKYNNILFLPSQESFTLEKYVEKLAQLNPDTGLGPLHRNKDKSKPFNPEVREHVACKTRQTNIMILLVN